MSLTSKVKETVRKHRMLSSGDGVLVAVSGGPDSVALLHVLWKLKNEFDLGLEVAHLEHGIRGEEAKEDARFVAKLADQLGLRFHLREVELPKIKAERGKGNLEALAREERYRFFTEVAGERGLKKIATAHTLSDQAETVLMWLLRGSGRKGLGGMAPVLKDEGGRMKAEVIRPLIEVARQEVEDYLAAEKLRYRVDRTNLDRALLRNWIRLKLLPQLRERIDERLEERLAQLAEMMRDEEEFLESLARNLFPRVAQGGNLLRGSLLSQPRAIERRLVRLWLEANLGSLRGVEFHHVEKILRLISEGPPQGRLAIPGGWDLVRQYETVRLEKKRRKREVSSYRYDLPIQGELFLPEAGLKIESSRSRLAPGASPRNHHEAFFDLDSLPERLTVRNFRAGDRFRPLGMKGHKKIKDLFIEKKVPLDVRSTLPLLLAREEILWIPGYGRSDVAKISPKTKQVVKLKLVALSSGR